MKRTNYRIVTFMGYMGYYPLPSPRGLLSGGNRVITLKDKIRLFGMRKVFYEDVTPMYSQCIPFRRDYTSLEELKKDNYSTNPLWNYPILDKDNYLKVWTGKIIKEINTDKDENI